MLMYLTPGYGAPTDVGGSARHLRFRIWRCHVPWQAKHDQSQLRQHAASTAGSGRVDSAATTSTRIWWRKLRWKPAAAWPRALFRSRDQLDSQGGRQHFRGSLAGLFGNDAAEQQPDRRAARPRLLGAEQGVLHLGLQCDVGGPIMQDRLWFFTGIRYFGNRMQLPNVSYNKTQGTPFFTPDLDRGPAIRSEVVEPTPSA